MRIVTKEFSYTLTTKCKNEVDLTMTRCKMITEPYTYTTLVTSVYTMRKSVAAKSQWYAATTETCNNLLWIIQYSTSRMGGVKT